jgi:hypothetical protein
MKVRAGRKKMSIIDKLFRRQKTTLKQPKYYYVQGSGLIRIPIGRLNEIPKVIREFHEQEAARMRLVR